MRVHGGIINKCHNEGKIEASVYNIGGIAGYIGTTGSITKCNNTGKIQATSFNLGGISGLSGVSIAGCYNEGKVNNEYNSLENPTINCNVGGILGTASAIISVENCYNVGGVYFKGASYVGGILGKASVTTLNNCYNIGEIIEIDWASASVGGIGGSLTVSWAGSVSNCCNYSDVSVHSTMIGGILGWLTGSQETIENCYNNGKICNINPKSYSRSRTQIAGIVAMGSGGGKTYRKCYNVGDLSNNYYNASEELIAGIACNASIEMTDCHNMGEIKGESTMNSYLNEICGNTGATLTNCTYLIRSNNVDAIGATGRTEEEMKQITDINKFVEKMNITVDEHNSSNPEFVWSKWIVKDGKAVFEIE